MLASHKMSITPFPLESGDRLRKAEASDDFSLVGNTALSSFDTVGWVTGRTIGPGIWHIEIFSLCPQNFSF